MRDSTRLTRVLRNANLKPEEKTLEAAWRSKYRIVTVEDRKSPHILDIVFRDRKRDMKTERISGLRTFYQRPESVVLVKFRMIKATIQPEREATDREDIRAILQSTHVSLRNLRGKARAENTWRLLNESISGVFRRTRKASSS